MDNPWLGRLLLVIWSLIALAYLGVFVIDLFVSYELLAAPCAGPDCHYQAIAGAEAAVLASWGLSVPFYALYMPGITATITATLKLPYVAIRVATVDGGRRTVAETGLPLASPAEWPLRFHEQMAGWLVVAPRAPGEAFTRQEKQLLADIAAQAGAAAHAAQLTADLQPSREKLVLAREEERRRIRRDLQMNSARHWPARLFPSTQPSICWTATPQPRHAAARTCRVSLVATGSQFAITISDDGAGLPANANRGLSLSSMRERAEELGGTFTIMNPPGGGTRLVTAMPL